MRSHSTTAQWRLYLFYWTTFIALSANVPFYSIYLKHLLVRADGQPILELLGLIFFIQPLLCILANPLAGYIADRFKIENRILLFCCSFTVLGGLCLGFPLFYRLMAPGSTGTGTLAGNFPLTLFFIGLGTALTGIFSGPVFPIINSETYEYLHTHPSSRKSYGHFRVQGTLCWILMTAVTGLALQLSQNLILIPLLFCTGYALCAILAFSGLKARVKPVKIPWHYLKKDRSFQLLLVFCFIQSFGLFSTNNFLGYFFDDQHLNYGFMGLAFSLSAIPEVPLMFLAGSISRRFGNRNMVITGTSILVLRLILLAGLAYVGHPLLCLAVMPIAGLGYGLQINGIMNLIDKMAHKDLRSTYMNLYTMLGVNVPLALGSLFNAFIIKQLSSSWMLVLNAGLVVFGIFFFLFFFKEEQTVEAAG